MNKGFCSAQAAIPALILALFALVLVPPLGCAAPPPEEEAPEADEGPRLRKPGSVRSAVQTPPRDRPTLKKARADRPVARISPEDRKKMREQEEAIAKLRKDLKDRDREVTELKTQIENLPVGEGPTAEKLLALTREKEDLERRLGEAETQIGDLRKQLQEAAGAEEGVDVARLVKERDALLEELDATKLLKGQAERQLAALSKEKLDWDEKMRPIEDARKKAEEDLVTARQERDAIEKERDELSGEVEGLKKQLHQAERAQALAEEKGKGVDALRTELAADEGDLSVKLANSNAGRAKVAALLGLILALGAIGLAVFLFLTLRQLKYEVAIVQAHSGGIDATEVEQLVNARMGEIAGDMQTLAGGGDIEGMVGETVKQAVTKELKSEAFQSQIKQAVTQNAGKGGGGRGGLSPQDVKVMVDNQFRAITTYLKNEAVPKMVEDALRKKEG